METFTRDSDGAKFEYLHIRGAEMINYLADVLEDEAGLTNYPGKVIEDNRLLLLQSLLEIDKEVQAEVYAYLNQRYKITGQLSNELRERFYNVSKDFTVSIEPEEALKSYVENQLTVSSS